MGAFLFGGGEGSPFAHLGHACLRSALRTWACSQKPAAKIASPARFFLANARTRLRLTRLLLPNKKPPYWAIFYLVTVDNNDMVSYGCIMVALELQPSERKNATLVKRVRQIGI